jgi:hypothetical protein
MPGLPQLAAILLASAVHQPTSPMKPLRLQVEQQGDATTIRIIGLANEPSSVSYALEVTDGGNRSTQRGVAHLQAGVRATVATVRLVSNRRLSAKLKVRPLAGAEYDEQFGTLSDPD